MATGTSAIQADFDKKTDTHSSRIRAGIARARAGGVRLGRPRISVDLEQARALRAEGRTLRAIGRVFGTSASTMGRLLSRDTAATVARKNT